MSDNQSKGFSDMPDRSRGHIARLKAAEYTPSTEEVRNSAAFAAVVAAMIPDEAMDIDFPEPGFRVAAKASFNLWLAEHDAEVVADRKELAEQLVAAQAVIAMALNAFDSFDPYVTRDILAGATFDALAAHDREVAAKAWGEGWNTGWDGRMLHDAGIEGHAEVPNPYISALVSEPSTAEQERRKS